MEDTENTERTEKESRAIPLCSLSVFSAVGLLFETFIVRD